MYPNLFLSIIWYQGEIPEDLSFFSSYTQHCIFSTPFTQTDVTRQEYLCKCLWVWMSEEVCCGLLNGHSRRWQAPKQAIAGLEHTPSGKPQPLLYQPTTAWPGHGHLLIPFLCLSLSLFFLWEVDPLNFLTNSRCPGSVVKGLFMCRKIKFICCC